MRVNENLSDMTFTLLKSSELKCAHLFFNSKSRLEFLKDIKRGGGVVFVLFAYGGTSNDWPYLLVMLTMS